MAFCQNFVTINAAILGLFRSKCLKLHNIIDSMPVWRSSCCIIRKQCGYVEHWMAAGLVFNQGNIKQRIDSP
jgi:hypothetical protein